MMGVKDLQNKKQQDKWNRFVALLIQNAGLPSTCLVRLIFKDPENKKYEISNYKDLKQLAIKHGDKTKTKNYITMNIIIEVMALTYDEYQKRFQYEQQEYMKLHKIPQNKSSSPSQLKQLEKFVLSPLTSTNAIIQKPIKPKPIHARSPSESPSIMDMLHVNQPINNEERRNEENNDVLNAMFNNNQQFQSQPQQQAPPKEDKPIPPKEAEPAIIQKPPSKPSPIPPSASIEVSESISASVVNNQPKKQLSTIYNYPKISFEELRFKHYMDNKKWGDMEEKQEIQFKLIIKNWPMAMNKETLTTIFNPYGNILLSQVEADFAVVIYQNEESCHKAIAALNGFQIGHNKLQVEIMRDEEEEEPEEEDEDDDNHAAQSEPDEKEEEEENKRLIIGNWPQSMGDGLLQTLFAPYGKLIFAQIVNECGIIEYETKEAAEKALKQLNGFQMGANKLVVSFAANDNMSHILRMGNDDREESDEENDDDNDDQGNEQSAGEEVEVEQQEDDFEQIGYPVNDEDDDVIQEEVEERQEEVEEEEVVPRVSIFEAEDAEVMQERQQEDDRRQEIRVDVVERVEEMDVNRININNMNMAAIMNKSRSTPNENDIQEMVNEENEKDLQQILHDEEQNAENYSHEPRAQSLKIVGGNEAVEDNEEKKRAQSEPHHQRQIEQGNDDDNNDVKDEQNEEESESDSDSSSDSSDFNSSDSDSSETSRKSKKLKKKKLSKKQLKKLKRKERRRKKRKMKRKKDKQLRKREKYVDKNINALNECLEKFTNLMSSVSQSAMVMQQSVAQMSQLHAQQQQQSMLYQQSMRSMFPNQPLYTSIIPQNANIANPNQQQQPGKQENDISQSMQNIINQITNTQGGPENNNNSNAENMSQSNTGNVSASPNPNNNNNNGTPKMNTDILNQQFLQQQQLIQQQALQIAQMQQQRQHSQSPQNWVNANYSKPSLNNNGNVNVNKLAPSSPILHSTHYSGGGQQQGHHQQQPVLNMLNNNNNGSMAGSGTMNLNSSGDSNNNNNNGESGAYNQSKSKIFEHKKALRNVSPEMEEKLNQLNEMGYTNRTFNLVLLKQENGDMNKVIENLKQFYKNN